MKVLNGDCFTCKFYPNCLTEEKCSKFAYNDYLTQRIENTLNSVGFRTYTIYAEFDGHPVYLNEYQVRALKLIVMCMSDTEYKQFCNKVTLYSGPTKKDSYIVTIDKQGDCHPNFEEGFMDVSTNLELNRFRLKPILS